MCGIIGYIGKKNGIDICLSGLKALEYRGYDSAGIAVTTGNNKIFLDKEKGELLNLEKALEKRTFSKGKTEVNVAIGHTRWATHGVPSKKNAHPHLSFDGKIAIVHNGIIENNFELKGELEKKYNIRFNSDTDSEVIAHLIAIHYKNNLLEAVQKAVLKLKGAYAFSAIAEGDTSSFVAVRKDAPLIVGVTKKQGNFIASDIPAILKWTRDVLFIENDEIVLVSENKVTIFDELLNEKTRKIKRVTWSMSAAEKGGYKHFMLKEIFEQPKAIKETLCRRLDGDKNIKLDSITLKKSFLKNIDRIIIVSCGTAFHAGLIGKQIIEKLVRIPTFVQVASEFRYSDPIVTKKTLCIAISQSGETLDTLEAIREVKKKGGRVLSIVNVIGSSIARESDDTFYTWAGPEIAVASTKAFTSQLICLYLLALFIAKKMETITENTYLEIISELEKLPKKIDTLLKNSKEIKALADKYYNEKQFFFIGRGLDSPNSFEASLKLKEISYINSFAIEAGELKHGTIALINKDSIVIAIATQKKLIEKLISNAKEIVARGGKIIFITDETSSKELLDITNETIKVPTASDIVMPILSAPAFQLFAYYIALKKGENIDKPKNLAKSVTVE